MNFFGDRFFQPYKINRNSIIESCDYKKIARKKKKVSIHFKYFIPISIAKKVEILYLPLTLESSPQSCVKVQPHQKHNVLRCEPNCH
ncbi:hypothetical protein, partial [Enterococcus faecium]|uniref:hypothetical protein n=1 Tax=Enterococcus faecium TaxID=1352 RepID=UPI0021AD084F